MRVLFLSICFSVVVSSCAFSRDLDENEKKIITEGVTRDFKDPYSAQIRFHRYVGGDIYCGTINAKNSYGGYGGFVPFYAFIGLDGNQRITSVKSSMLGETSSDERLVDNLCLVNGYNVR